MMRENIEKYRQKYRQPCDLGSHFGACCMIVSRGGALFLRPVFRNLWGVPPWTNFGLPWGILGPILSISCKLSGAKLVQNSETPEQQIAPTTPSKKQARIPKQLYR